MAEQRNFAYGSYDSDDGNSYCLKADQDWTEAAASGGTACAGEPAYGRATSRRSPRKFIFRDAATFRTFTGPVFTPAAYAAGVVGTTTYSVPIHGAAVAVAYTLVKKVPERVPSTVIGQRVLDAA